MIEVDVKSDQVNVLNGQGAGELEKQEMVLLKKKAIKELEEKLAKSELEIIKANKDAIIERKQQAEYEKALVDANRSRFTSPSTIVPMSGDVTINGSGFSEASALVHKSLMNNIKKLVANFKKYANEPSKKVSIIIYNQPDLNPLWTYVTIKEQLESLFQFNKAVISKLDEVILEKKDTRVSAFALDPLLFPIAATSITKTLAEFAQLFKTTVDYNNTTIVLDESALVSSLVAVLRSDKLLWDVYHPSVIPIGFINRIKPENSGIIDMFNNIGVYRDVNAEKIAYGESKISDLEGKLNTLLQSLPIDNVKAESLTYRLNIIKGCIGHLRSLNSTYSSIVNYLSQNDSTTNISTLALLFKAEQLYNKLNDPSASAYVLKFNLVASSSRKVSKSLWRDARITHSAGTELTYQFFNNSGQLVCAECLFDYVPYTKPDKININDSN